MTIDRVSAGLILLIILLIGFFFFWFDPEIDRMSNWKTIEGIWEITPDPIILKDKWKTMPPQNGLIVMVDPNDDPRGYMEAKYKVKVAFCDIRKGAVVPGSESSLVDTTARLSNTAINVVCDVPNGSPSCGNHTLEFLTICKKTLYGYTQGPGYDTVVIFKRLLT